MRNLEQATLKALKDLDLRQQLLFCKAYLPDAWECLRDANSLKLPKFDDNDEITSWGATPQDKEDDSDESIFKSRT